MPTMRQCRKCPDGPGSGSIAYPSSTARAADAKRPTMVAASVVSRSDADPGPLRVLQPVPEHWVDDPAHVECGPVGVDGDFAGEAEALGARAGPSQGGLAARAVVVEGLAGMIVGAADHGLFVIGDRFG